jgi:nicotinamide phosphoribosyltransferase
MTVHEMNPLFLCDGYKLSHREQYPEFTEKVYAEWIGRKSRIVGIDKIVNFGLQYFIKEYLIDRFNEKFFGTELERLANGPAIKEKACKEYQLHVEKYLNCTYDIKHIEALWDLGYLPIEIKSLPEGTFVPIGIPMFTINNTLPEFFWLTNYLETVISDTVWMAMTSATIAHNYRLIFEKWAKITGCKAQIIPGVLDNIDVQGHDFSMRGMAGSEAAIISGMAHLTSFKGTDTLPAILALNEYYNSEEDFVGTSVSATEHSVESSSILILEEEFKEGKHQDLLDEFISRSK